MHHAEMNIVTTKRLDVGEITVEDVNENKKFLSSILKIPYHLLVLFAVLYGSFLLEFWIPKELVFFPVATCSFYSYLYFYYYSYPTLLSLVFVEKHLLLFKMHPPNVKA